MIKVTFDEDSKICECGHLRKDHNSWGSRCYRMVHRKERRKDKDGKYQIYQTHYNCSCMEFKELENKL